MEANKIYDTCVVCEKETEEEINKHIDLRYYYVEGAGQHCRDCFQEIYE
jgi:hypothetical protein